MTLRLSSRTGGIRKKLTVDCVVASPCNLQKDFSEMKANRENTFMRDTEIGFWE